MTNENTNPKVKILVGYHKPAVLLKDEILTPIHLGRELATQASKDGEMLQEDFEWLCENMIGDNTGENISYLNRYFCELTGIYWAWKNYDKLGNPDYIGFMHYRRHFIFDEKDDALYYKTTSCTYYQSKFYKKKLFFLLKKYNFLTTNVHINKKTIKEYYQEDGVKCGSHVAKDFDILAKIIKKIDKEFYNSFLHFSHSNVHMGIANMFIMNRDMFFTYCKFIFDILFQVHKKLIYVGRSEEEKRAIGFLSERLTGAFIYSLPEQDIKIGRMPMLYIESSEMPFLGSISNDLAYPIISVIMPCYNRQEYVADAIESILNQTYTNFEFIIIDDCSTDNTYEIIKKYAEIDKRIIALQNEENKGIVYTLNRGFGLARGKYIARMDDDDISLPQRFEKQIKYMEEHEDVTVLGSLIETFPHAGGSWCPSVSTDLTKLLLHFFNPLAHSVIMIRNAFLQKYNIKYLKTYEYAEEYKLYCDILQHGGKIYNMDEVLLYCRRTGRNNIGSNEQTRKIQQNVVRKICVHMLSQVLKKEDVELVIKNVINWPFEKNKAVLLYQIFTLMQKNDKNHIISEKAYDDALVKYCGIKEKIHIFFAINDNYAQHLCVTIASILKNSTPLDEFCFYILNKGDLTVANKTIIESLKGVKSFEIEFIEINNSLFQKCQLTKECPHITEETYYRYIIPQLKPDLEKSLYLDCDLIVEDSLNLLWNTDLKDNYVGAVEEFWPGAKNYYKENFDINCSFNAGVLLINHKKWIADNITDKLFYNTEIIKLQGKNKWVDQDVLNFTFRHKWFALEPKYNVQSHRFIDSTNFTNYINLEYSLLSSYHTIIHYTGAKKPWLDTFHPLWHRYWYYIKFTSFSYLLSTQFNKLWSYHNLKLYSATDRVKDHLSYKLGNEIVQVKNLSTFFTLLPKIIKIKKMHTKKLEAYKTMIKFYPHLQVSNLEDCIDYQQALKIKNYLSYRLGNALVKHPFTFIFRVGKIYKEWRKEKKG